MGRVRKGGFRRARNNDVVGLGGRDESGAGRMWWDQNSWSLFNFGVNLNRI